MGFSIIDDERFWILWSKRKTEELTSAESTELTGLMEKLAVSGIRLDLVDQLWNAHLQPYPTENISELPWQRMQGQLFPAEPNQPAIVQGTAAPRKIRIMRRWLVAASVLLLLAGSMFVFQWIRPLASSGKQLNQVMTEPDSKSQVELPDGTTVWLNKGSKLTYSTDFFGEKHRVVNLVGEAFFDVKKNESVPFIIHTDEIQITVKGTAFNVKAYPGSKRVEAALVRGLIEISTRGDADRQILLRPNEKFTLDLDQSPNGKDERKFPGNDSSSSLSYAITRLKSFPGNEPAETAWMNQRLYFNDESLGDLAPKLESWYNVKIRFADEALRNKRFSGVVEKESLLELLKVLQLSSTFRYKIEGDLLIIG